MELFFHERLWIRKQVAYRGSFHTQQNQQCIWGSFVLIVAGGYYTRYDVNDVHVLRILL